MFRHYVPSQLHPILGLRPIYVITPPGGRLSLLRSLRNHVGVNRHNDGVLRHMHHQLLMIHIPFRRNLVSCPATHLRRYWAVLVAQGRVLLDVFVGGPTRLDCMDPVSYTHL